jgi:sulfonate dioxygenase
MQEFLDKIYAIHSSEKMIQKTRQLGGLVRKEPVRSVHPLVRVHPVTGKKSLFINREFVTGLVGFKESESDMLLNFLLNHLVTGHDFQARVRWAPKTIVLFDNRSTIRKCGPSICPFPASLVAICSTDGLRY